RELLEPHIRLIDKEIARLKAMAAGLGSEFEFTPEGKQRLINDLLAHRAALISGRPAAEFTAQTRQLGHLQGQYERTIEQLRNNLEDQAVQIRQQQQQLERQRRDHELLIQQYRYLRLPH
ncbi:MAG: hypothetical protein PHE55_10445, partial [Methylococcaceae bacterium]|nr:hypothetical protein [Methylococcaceae bacterium]